MFLCRNLSYVAAVWLISIACQNAQASVIFSEIGDAGATLATANVTIGLGALDAIIGTLPDADPSNVDIYALNIPDLSLFSASTDNFPDTDLLASWLYLFRGDGTGVAASASTAGGSFNATISLGSLSGPAGLYYLAITRFETVPFSGSGQIFPDLFVSSTNGEVLGATGPGGAEPLAGWNAPALRDFENYRIDLTGATPVHSSAVVPELSSVLTWTLATLFSIIITLLRQHSSFPSLSRFA